MPCESRGFEPHLEYYPNDRIFFLHFLLLFALVSVRLGGDVTRNFKEMLDRKAK
jgi:hypothetical protein